MGGVTRTIRKAIRNPVKAVKETVGAAANVVAPVPIAGDIVKAVERRVSPPSDVVRTSGYAAETGLAPNVGQAVAKATSATEPTKPKAVTAAGSAGSTSSATYNMRRRRGRGIATGSRGLTTSAPVQRKTLLGG